MMMSCHHPLQPLKVMASNCSRRTPRQQRKSSEKSQSGKMESVLKKVVKDVIDAQHESDVIFLALEEKRRKFKLSSKNTSETFRCK